MIINRDSTIMNAIIERTANTMNQTLYQNAMTNLQLNGVNRGYNITENTQYARGVQKPIVCGQSKCGSEENPVDEHCQKF